jgi:hypothetical protein
MSVCVPEKNLIFVVLVSGDDAKSSPFLHVNRIAGGGPAPLGVFGKSDPGLEYFLQVPGYVCYTYPDSGYACTIEKRVTRTRLVVAAAGCALAAASWLRASSRRATV